MEIIITKIDVGPPFTIDYSWRGNGGFQMEWPTKQDFVEWVRTPEWQEHDSELIRLIALWQIKQGGGINAIQLPMRIKVDFSVSKVVDIHKVIT
jgi:hypothetical protein